MTTIAASPHAWIGAVCRQFTDSSGWELRFRPVGGERADDVEAALRADPETCWFSEISDGHSRVGFLHLRLPPDGGRDRDFTVASELAEVVTALIARAATASRLLDSRTSELATLVDIGRSVPSEENLAEAIDCLLRGAIQLTSFRSAAFFLLDPSTERLKLRALTQRDLHMLPAEVRRLSENPPDIEALARGRALFTNDRTDKAAAWLPPGTLTALCLAVGSESGPLGTLWVYDRRRREPTDRELHVLESIAVQIATLLERVVLLRESAAQHRLQRDLQLASQCQAFDVVTSLPQGAGIEAAARSTSRFEIGGDLCELISADRERTVLSIGDASGHGVSAAIVMSAVRGAVRALAIDPKSFPSPENVLERVNRALYSITPPHQFMSLLYGVVDTRRKLLTYSNAGHPSPVLLRSGQPLMLDSHGMLLGVLTDTTYSESSLPITSGDTLVAFTDGVSEAMNGKRKMFRSDGIIDVLQDNESKSPAAILDAIWKELDSHLDGTKGHDDRSLMVIRVR